MAIDETATLRALARTRRRRRFRLALVAGIVLVLSGLGAWAWYETRSAEWQAGVFHRLAAESVYRVEPGPNPALWLPEAGPHDLRLGYARLKVMLPRLLQGGFEVSAQARQSARFVELAGHGLFPPYREKSQAGLTLVDRHGETLYATRHPQRQYADFAAIPPLLVASLLFIENRELLDDAWPRRNPAVEWERLGWAAVSQALRAADLEAARAGGSTLATQIEKFRHSPGGRTREATDKARQMISAALRAYQDGEDTSLARRRIVLDFVNSVPLGAVPGLGEINGLGDGLWAWYGRDFAEANRRIAAAADDPQAAAAAFKEALSLFIAQRRPAELLAEPVRLAELTDSYLRLLARTGLIPEALRDAALAAGLAPQGRPAGQGPLSLAERKAVNAVRTSLADLLGMDNLYELDRLDLTVRTTLDASVQAAVTGFLVRLRDESFLQCLGLNGERLLARGDPREVRYSFTLYEAAADGNQLRVQADNVDQPLDINAGTKLDLGSSAKFRTLVSYLEVVADLHRRYSDLPGAKLRQLDLAPGDALSRWAADYLAASRDRSLGAMLAAALERRYSSAPGESFFTGGGMHVFANFRREDDGRMASVGEALEQSLNLPFIRIMRDVVHYHAHEAEDAPGRALRSGDPGARKALIARFADMEGRNFLAHFYRKYRKNSPEDLLPALVADLRPLPARLAAAYLSVEPEADFSAFSAFMKSRLGGRVQDEALLERLYAAHAPLRHSLADRGYAARIHPLELWLVGYLRRHPGATFEQVLAASGQERQQAYQWLLAPRFQRAQETRIGIVLEHLAFERIAASWKRLGYPFERLVPSYATAIGSSADRPAALAELMGVVVNGGVRRPPVRVDGLEFAVDTPYETRLIRRQGGSERVLPPEVAEAARAALMRVVANGTARRLAGVFRDEQGRPLSAGGKTGTGDHRFDVFGPGGQLVSSRVMNRAATFVFFIGDRLFGTVTAFVPGEQAAGYEFTSALPVQVLKGMEPLLRPLVSGLPAGKPACGM